MYCFWKLLNRLLGPYFFSILSLVYGLFSLDAWSQGNGDQLQHLEKKVDKVIEKQDTVKNDPILSKKFGIELNPIRLLFIESDYKTFSAGLSFFNVFPKVELAIPIYIGVFEGNIDIFEDSDYYGNRTKYYVLTIDGHYRYFLGKQVKGFYMSGFSRFASLRGRLRRGGGRHGELRQRETEYKLGFGFGVGYRVFSKSGWYWGISLSIGRYFIGENDKFVTPASLLIIIDTDDHKKFLDIELLKFGYAF